MKDGGLRQAHDALERWGVILKPWYAHFKLMDSVLTNDAVVHVDLGVDVAQKPWRENVLHTRETLELLALVAFAEKMTKTATVDSVTSSQALPSASSPHPLYVLNCYNRNCIKYEHDVEVFKVFFFAFDDGELRDEFRSALQQIHERLSLAIRSEVAKHWQLRVRFVMSTTRHGPELSKVYLTSALELVKGIAGRASQATTAAQEGMVNQWQYRFPYTDTVERLVTSRCKLEPSAAPVLAELIALGVAIKGPIALGSNSALGGLPVSKLGSVFHAMTEGATSDGYEKLSCDDWGVLSLQNWAPASKNHARVLQAVCSSLAVCTNFKELHLSNVGGGYSRESRQKVLQWLAYALFSNESASAVTSLTLNPMLVNDEDMVAIINVLMAKQPAKELLDAVCFQDERENNGDSLNKGVRDNIKTEKDYDPGFLVLGAGTAISVAAIDGDDTEVESTVESFALNEDGCFRVLRNDMSRDGVDILVPHYGYCIVPRASVDHFEPTTLVTKASLAYDGAITTLKVKKCSNKALLPLIAYVGFKLRSLEVSSNVKASFLSRALAACPNLEKLTIVNPAENMETALMDVYKRQQCKCPWLRITEYPSAQEDFTTMIAFLRMLKDPKSAAAKTIRYLEVRTEKNSWLDESVLEEIAEMLQGNRTIEHLQISLCKQYYHHDPEPVLMRTNGQQLPPRQLSVASRLAFLSVLQHFVSSETVEPLSQKRARYADATSVDHGKTDRSVIASIFAFAAEPVVRRVRLDVEFMEY